MPSDPQKPGFSQAEPRRAPVIQPKRALTPVAPNVDAVRGLACLLIVALHMVGDQDTNGLELPMTSGWHYAMESVEFLRIPLFTALSGYLYAGRRVTLESLPGFWMKKLRRLGAPLVFVTVVMWWLRGHAQADTTSLPTALLFEYGHLWYLQSLLILFTGISLSDAFLKPDTVALVLAGLMATMLDQSGVSVTTFFGLAGSFYLAPYFLFGIILRDRPEWLRDPRSGVLAFGIVATVLTSQQLGMFGIINPVTLLQLPAALAGMAGVVLLLQRFPKYAPLARIGRYSYTIYLWHVLAGAALREALLRIGITSIPVLFLCTLVAGITVPIMLYHIARRIPWISEGVTGDRWIGANAGMRTMHATAMRS